MDNSKVKQKPNEKAQKGGAPKEPRGPQNRKQQPLPEGVKKIDKQGRLYHEKPQTVKIDRKEEAPKGRPKLIVKEATVPKPVAPQPVQKELEPETVDNWEEIETEKAQGQTDALLEKAEEKVETAEIKEVPFGHYQALYFLPRSEEQAKKFVTVKAVGNFTEDEVKLLEERSIPYMKHSKSQPRPSFLREAQRHLNFMKMVEDIFDSGKHEDPRKKRPGPEEGDDVGKRRPIVLDVGGCVRDALYFNAWGFDYKSVGPILSAKDYEKNRSLQNSGYTVFPITLEEFLRNNRNEEFDFVFFNHSLYYIDAEIVEEVTKRSAWGRAYAVHWDFKFYSYVVPDHLEYFHNTTLDEITCRVGKHSFVHSSLRWLERHSTGCADGIIWKTKSYFGEMCLTRFEAVAVCVPESALSNRKLGGVVGLQDGQITTVKEVASPVYVEVVVKKKSSSFLARWVLGAVAPLETETILVVRQMVDEAKKALAGVSREPEQLSIVIRRMHSLAKSFHIPSDQVDEFVHRSVRVAFYEIDGVAETFETGKVLRHDLRAFNASLSWNEDRKANSMIWLRSLVTRIGEEIRRGNGATLVWAGGFVATATARACWTVATVAGQKILPHLETVCANASNVVAWASDKRIPVLKGRDLDVLLGLGIAAVGAVACVQAVMFGAKTFVKMRNFWTQARKGVRRV
jgi:hypothetical protein